jgi:hypothetical protein
MRGIRFLLSAAAVCFSTSALSIGAIAVDDVVGETEPGFGFSTGHSSRERAERAAMRQCREAGNRRCEVKVWFESCGAYAASRRYFGVGWGADLQTATSMALQKCGRPQCKIKVSKCE